MTSTSSPKHLELIAIGPLPDDRWRRIIPKDRVIRLGRAPKNGWAVPWDRWISREQADLRVVDDHVQVTCLETATNQITWQGELCRECSLNHGDEFQIGQTRFVVGPSVDPVHEKETVAADSQLSIDDIVSQPQQQRLEHVLSMLSSDQREGPPNPQGISAENVPARPAAVQPAPPPLPAADAAEPPPFAKPIASGFPDASWPASPPDTEPPPVEDAPTLQHNIGPDPPARDLESELEQLARQKSDRSMEARFLREEVAELRSKLRKTTSSDVEPLQTPAKDVASEEPSRAKDIADLQDEIRTLQELLRNQLEAIQQRATNAGTHTQLELTKASLEAEKLAREKAQQEALALRDEIAALQSHMQDVTAGEVAEEPKENAGALETHLGLAAVEEDDAEEPGSGQAGAAIFRHYELLNQVYNGGVGQVLQAKHQRLNRIVAIKLVTENEKNSVSIGRFGRKVQILAYLDHPNLVTAYDAGQEGNVHYLVTEYVPGRSMIRLLKRIKQLDIPHAIHFISQTCNALEYVHERRIYHRNINPSHLLVTPEKSIKIVGWGSSLFAGDEKLKQFEAQGIFVGTPDYVAPEQIDNSAAVDHRADIYSLGCTLYAILTKEVIYPVDWARRKLIAQRHKPAPQLRDLRPDAPNVLEEIFQKMVAKDPDERFQSMAEVRDALNQVAQLPEDT